MRTVSPPRIFAVIARAATAFGLAAGVAACSLAPSRPEPARPEPARRVASAPAWKFAVLSDIHVNPHAVAAPAFKKLVAKLVELRLKGEANLRFVVITGDSTNGNDFDHYSAATIDRWWASVKAALEPLHALGVPILPVAGNHDFYLPVHREGFQRAWGDLHEYAGPIALAGNPPFYYSADVDGVHLALLQVVTQSIPAAERQWLQEDLAAAAVARLRLAFGHVPFLSVMSLRVQPFELAFEKDFGGLLAEGGVAAYIAGHEHLVWDEARTIDGKPIRQVIVGTASATYTFELSPRERAAHCADGRCTMPFPAAGQGTPFTLEPGTGQQRHHQSFTMIEVTEDGYAIRPLTLDQDDEIIPFSD